MKKVIIITGASRGLGCELALRFAEAGFRVVVNYLHSKDSADEIVKEIFNKGGEALSFSADVRSPEDVKSIITSIYEQWGTIDILINNAAITKDKIVSSNILNREQDMAEVVEFIYNLSKMNNVSGQIFNLDSRIL